MKNTYFGFTDSIKPMQAARIEKSLDLLLRFDHEEKELVKTSKEFVYMKLQSGCKPDYEENYSYYSRRLDDYTKPKTLYKLVHPDGSTYNEVNKTLYNYALHLIENDLLDEHKAIAFIEQEQKEKEEAERFEQERIQKEREEKQKQIDEEERKRKAEYQKKQEQWFAIGEQFLKGFEENPITASLDQHWSDLQELYPQEPLEQQETYERLTNQLTVMLGNQGLCSHRLQYFVECENEEDGRSFTLKGNPSMFFEKEVLFKAFEVQLSDKPATITAKVKAAFEGREYKGSKPIKLETFYYLESSQFIECQAQPFSYEGIEFFILTKDEHSIYEARSGGKVWSHTSKSELLKKVKETIKNKKSILQSSAKRLIEKNGLSPRYKIEEKPKQLFVPEVSFNEEGQGVLF